MTECKECGSPTGGHNLGCKVGHAEALAAVGMVWRYDVDDAGGEVDTPAFFFLVTAEGTDERKRSARQVGEAWRDDDGRIFWASQSADKDDPPIESDGWEIIAWMPMPLAASRPLTASRIGGDRRPLNGTKTHPLSKAALAYLRQIVRGPVPRSSVNAGVVDRLTRGSLVTIEPRPSPFASHKGKNIDHLVATEAGKERAAQP